MAEAQILSLIPERLAEFFKAAGYRAEIAQDNAGVPHLRSATGGVQFNVRFGNRAAPPVEGFMDFTYMVVIRVQEGDFPLERVNEWNRQRRFARLQKADDFLIMDFDVICAGGVTETYLRGTLELWDRLVQELVQYLQGQNAAAPAANTNQA